MSTHASQVHISSKLLATQTTRKCPWWQWHWHSIPGDRGCGPQSTAAFRFTRRSVFSERAVPGGRLGGTEQPVLKTRAFWPGSKPQCLLLKQPTMPSSGADDRWSLRILRRKSGSRRGSSACAKTSAARRVVRRQAAKDFFDKSRPRPSAVEQPGNQILASRTTTDFQKWNHRYAR